MSEENAVYRINTKPRNLPAATLLKFNDLNYQSPTAEDVRTLKDISEKTGRELGELVGVEPRTFRKWTAPESANQKTKIPYAAWRLLLIELNLI